jgi:hypothetical protein
MTIDAIEAFEALTHYGIRVARSKFVDCAEDAIAFAERRTARDPRFMPIVLRSMLSGAQSGVESAGAKSALRTEDAIRQAYEALVQGGAGRRILAQAVADPGTDITIAGLTKEASGKILALHSATHSVERMIPLDSAGAEALASNFQGHHHHGSSEKARRMLEHLLIRTAAFFEHSCVSEFRLVVRMHENSYTVLDASMIAPRPLHLKERLDPRAHDRKGDDFRPTGVQ